MKPRTTPATALGQWLGYSSMATALLAVHGKADAQVLYTDLDPDAVISNGSMEFDLDGDGVIDVRLGHVMGTHRYATFRPPNGAVIGQEFNSLIYVSQLASGAPIAPANQNFHFLDLTIAELAANVDLGGSPSGQFPGQTGFVGFRFTGGDNALHYAWIQLSIPLDVHNLTVMDYGYETVPNMAIFAGDMGNAGLGAGNARVFNIEVTPNPIHDNALITFPNTGTGHMQMSLMNGLGETLLTVPLGNTESYRLNLTGIPSGVYFVRLQNDTKVAFQKVLKE
ncbi:MAG: T9SS type A sorting domain-containing protein [Flavobacteriales bacterium]